MKKETKANLQDAGAFGGGALIGGTVSKGINRFLPTEANTKIGVKAVLCAGGIIAMALIPKGNAVNQLGKGAALGMAVEKGMSAISDFAATTSLATTDATDKPLVKFAQDATGLSGDCGCTTAPVQQRIATLNFPVRQFNHARPINMMEVAPNKYTAASFA